MIRILHGDCREVLNSLPDNSVHCCVTSPPYYGLRDYQVAGQIGLEASPDEYVAQLVAVFREVRRVLRDDGTLWCNLGDGYSGGPSHAHEGMAALGAQYRGGGHKLTAIDKPQRSAGTKPKDLLMMPARVALALQADGWWLRSDIIWAKKNCMPESVTDRPTSSHEHVFLLAKSPRYFYDAEAVKEDSITGDMRRPYGSQGAWEIDGRPPEQRHGGKPRKALAGPTYERHRSAIDGGQSLQAEPNGTRNLRNVWTIATNPYPDAHFATFPPELAERCIKAGTSEKGCCANCGAPWVRQTQTDYKRHEKWFGDKQDARHSRGSAGVGYNEPIATRTIGWSPSCQCKVLSGTGAERGEVGTVPCTVLDCFAGAFTAPMVADRLQRNAIGIELSEAYCSMARARLVADAGMFAEIAD